MRSPAKVWVTSVALALSACAEQEAAESGRKSVPRTAAGGDSYDYTPSGYSGAQAGKGGATPTAAGSSGEAGAGGEPASGGGGAPAGSSSTDCPSLTLVRLPNGACAPRVTEYGVARKPTSIVRGADGKIWVDDEDGDELLQLDDSGQVIGRVSCDPGSSPRALVGGTGDAVLWYTDASAKTLVKLTRDKGKIVTPLGFEASALAPVGDDELFIAEFGKAIYRHRPNQLTPTRWDASPTDAMALGPEGAVWFSQGAGLAQLVPATGVTDFFFGDASYASGLCIGPDSALWFSDGFASQLVRVSWNGFPSRTINLPTGTSPGRIISGPDGALWFVETGTSRMGRVPLTGEMTHYPLPTPDSLPHALTVGSDGNIWFTEFGSGKVGRLIPDPLP